MENSSDKSYLPLFRKYRPQSFSDVVGQESLVRALSNAIELNRIANAYLFCGPRGTGKTSTARIFAKSLNCTQGPTLNPCQKCASCVDITNASGLDVIEIDAASNRGIQDAKDLISQVQYAPINGKYKIFIIDEVHMLSNDAFNALLKTFEEPPQNVIFILATTEPHKVLETIVSRCQRFDLRRITTDDIVKRLREISNLENIKIADSALFTIAKNVSGGLRDSLALLDQVSILGTKEEITKDLIEELLGKINFDVLLNLFKNIVEQNIEQTLLFVDEIYSKGNEPRNLCENFIEFLRNVVLILNSDDNDNISKFTYLIKEDIEKVKKENFDKDKTIKILNIIIEYYKEIKVSTNPYLWMELAALAACRLDLNIDTKTPVARNNAKIQTIQRQEIKQEPPSRTEIAKEIYKPITKEEIEVKDSVGEAVENTVEIQPKEEKPSQNPVPQPPVSDNDNSSSLWANIVSSITSVPTRMFYSGIAKLVKIENNKITVGFLHENGLAQAKSDARLKHLNSAIKNIAPDYSIELVKIGADTKTIDVNIKPQQRPQQSYTPPQTSYSQPQPQTTQNENQKPSADENPKQEEEAASVEKKHYSPKVRDMIEQFSGRIIE